jgi:hypothetical protein
VGKSIISAVISAGFANFSYFLKPADQRVNYLGRRRFAPSSPLTLASDLIANRAWPM